LNRRHKGAEVKGIEVNPFEFVDGCWGYRGLLNPCFYGSIGELHGYFLQGYGSRLLL
jgi:hypothetical protein